MRIPSYFSRAFALTAVSLMGLSPAAPATEAAVITATSDGYGLNVDLQALSLVHLVAGPLPDGVAGTAPAPYNLSDTAADVNVTASVPLVASGSVTADLVSGSAVSDVDGLLGVRTTSASGSIAGAGIQLATLPALGSGLVLVGLGDGTLESSASITGDYGSLIATGSTNIQSLTLTIAGVPVDLSAYVGTSIAPNTSVDLFVLGIANASLILNEQIIAPDHSSIEVNAFHLSLDILGAVTGSIILGHSHASVVAIPEPVSLGLLGAAGMLMLRRRRPEDCRS